MRLVERESECARLDALVAARSGVAVVEGPQGIGKSALLEWLAARCHAVGVPLLAVRPTRLSADVPFAAARRLLEPEVRRQPSVLQTGWARRVGPLFAGDAPAGGLAAPLIEGLVAVVAELVRAGGPAILAVDDAQWVDPSSLRFLSEIAERSREVGAGLALAISTTAEPTDAGTLARICGLADGGVIAPGPLSQAGVRSLMLDDDEARARRVSIATAGNPLLVLALRDDPSAGGQVPDSVTRLVLSRLEDLTAAAQALAEAVAVLGEARLHDAAALAGLPDGVADDAADALVARHVLAPGEPVRFAQPIVAEALLATVPGFALAARHRRAAELLAQIGADPDQLAAHLSRARPASDAWTSEVLRDAAATALGRGDPSSAVRLLQRAHAEPPPVASRGPVLLELARAQAAAGSPSAIEAFQHALDQLQDPARRADAWHGLSRLLYVRTEHRLAATAAAQGAADLPEGDPRRQRLMADELAAAMFVPELIGEAVARTEALIGTEPPSDPSLLAHLIVHQSWRGIDVDRLPRMAEAAVAADPLVEPESGGFALSFVAGALNMIDRTAQSRRLLDAGLARVAELGDPLAEVSLRCCRAWAALYQGALAAAGQDLDAVLALNRLGWPAVDGLCGPPLVRLRIETGDLDGAREALRRTPPGVHNPGLAWFQGSIAYAAGDPAGALAAFEEAGAELEGMLGMGNPGVLPWRSSAALAAAALGLRDRARALVAPELAQATALQVPRAEGIALRVSGFVDDDVAALERSVSVLERSSARLELARSLLFLGIAYRHARRTRDARAPLGRAQELAHECGATVVAERALLELRAAGARPRRRPRQGPDALTSSERNVAQLAAGGRTNRQIAAELFLTPKTVETHLTRAFRKLQISSRTELEALLEPRDAPDPHSEQPERGRSPSAA